jgi:hypothetical protein
MKEIAEPKPINNAGDDPALTAIERALAKALISVLLKEIRNTGPRLVQKLIA